MKIPYITQNKIYLFWKGIRGDKYGINLVPA